MKKNVKRVLPAVLSIMLGFAGFLTPVSAADEEPGEPGTQLPDPTGLTWGSNYIKTMGVWDRVENENIDHYKVIVSKDGTIPSKNMRSKERTTAAISKIL